MSDYISRETAIETIKGYGKAAISAERKSLDPVGDTVGIAYVIKVMPAADVEPVVHGRWEKSENRGFVRCSVCKDAYIDEEWLSSGKWGGCPNCRAKMDLAPPEGDNHG